VKRLAAMMHVLRMALSFLAAMLSLVVISVVFNTIRLQVMTQREEIEVSRLFGATNAFIYRPFCYTGALLGLVAGIAALVAVTLALYPLNAAVAEFARMYASEFRLTSLDFYSICILLAISGLLGLTGAFLSVRRHLH
jgi:cell division transport system permease protein